MPGTDLLSYALLLFVIFVYLPYALFRLAAEVFIDLTRRPDASQLEEIVAASFPALLLNTVAWLFYVWWSADGSPVWGIDWAAVASMFARDRGALADYVYAGKLAAPWMYMKCLAFIAITWGLVFGYSARYLCGFPQALGGIERLFSNKTSHHADDTSSIESTETAEKHDVTAESERSAGHVAERLPKRLGNWTRTFLRRLPSFVAFQWRTLLSEGPKILAKCLCFPWRFFFDESFVPLYTWIVQEPLVYIRTTDGQWHSGRLLMYERAANGRIDAIHLLTASSSHDDKVSARLQIGKGAEHVYLKWPQVAEMRTALTAEASVTSPAFGDVANAAGLAPHDAAPKVPIQRPQP